MPCDRIITFKYDMGTGTSPAVLGQALERMGMKRVTVRGEAVQWEDARGRSATFNKRTGQITAESGMDLEATKRYYSQQVAMNQAQRTGFRVRVIEEGRSFEVEKA